MGGLDWDEGEVEQFVEAVAHEAGDEEKDDRTYGVARALERIDGNEPSTGWPTVARLIGARGKEVIARVRELLAPTAGGSPRTRPQRDEREERSSQVERIVALVTQLKGELFKDSHGTAHLSFMKDGHRETWSLESPEAGDLIGHYFYDSFEEVARRQAID